MDFSYTFQTHFVQLNKPSQIFIRPSGMQALPSRVNSIIMKKPHISQQHLYLQHNILYTA